MKHAAWAADQSSQLPALLSDQFWPKIGDHWRASMPEIRVGRIWNKWRPTDRVRPKYCGQDLNQANYAVELSCPEWLYNCTRAITGQGQGVQIKWSMTNVRFEVSGGPQRCGVARLFVMRSSEWNALHFSHTQVSAIEMNDKLNKTYHYWLASARQVICPAHTHFLKQWPKTPYSNNMQHTAWSGRNKTLYTQR